MNLKKLRIFTIVPLMGLGFQTNMVEAPFVVLPKKSYDVASFPDPRSEKAVFCEYGHIWISSDEPNEDGHTNAKRITATSTMVMAYVYDATDGNSKKSYGFTFEDLFGYAPTEEDTYFYLKFMGTQNPWVYPTAENGVTSNMDYKVFDRYMVIDMNQLIDDPNELVFDSTLTEGIDGEEYFSYGYFYIDKEGLAGKTVTFDIDSEKPQTIDQIIATANAKNLFGKNTRISMSDDEKNKYDKNAIGSYKLEVAIETNTGKQVKGFLLINVKDTLSPVVSIVKNAKLDYRIGDSLTMESLKSLFTISDNGTKHGGTIKEASYFWDGNIINETLTFKEEDVGPHKVKIIVQDSSGNVGKYEFAINVNDDIGPVITCKFADNVVRIGLKRAMDIKKEEFLSFFKAEDAVDGDVSSTLDVDGNFIGTKPGTYNIIVTAKDKANNKATLNVTVEVIEDVPDVIILNDLQVNAYTDSVLTSDDIRKIIVNGIYPEKNLAANNITINDSDYQQHARIVGTYEVTYKANFSQGNEAKNVEGKLSILVTERLEEIKDDVNWFVGFFQRVGNWFRGIFTHFDFTCFITNKEFDIRYPDKEQTSTKDVSAV